VVSLKTRECEMKIVMRISIAESKSWSKANAYYRRGNNDWWSHRSPTWNRMYFWSMFDNRYRFAYMSVAFRKASSFWDFIFDQRS
jgi:hypothetical protein